MQIELAGAGVALEGDENPIAEAALAALLANGGLPARQKTADVLLVSCRLLPDPAGMDIRGKLQTTRQAAATMAARGRGRILFLLSAIAGMPMRRHPDFSAENAGLVGGMRTLAMEFGPSVLVNAVGLGLIGEGHTISGDAAQLSHVPLGRPGTVAEAVAAVLFLCDPANSYTTGQLLSVDGGWTAGYGRNF
jgi:NAD(P)-dependent dehydrogenase (short-subunit alcohol dehydrogenase family)